MVFCCFLLDIDHEVLIFMFQKNSIIFSCFKRTRCRRSEAAVASLTRSDHVAIVANALSLDEFGRRGDRVLAHDDLPSAN
jgi:hypothetical protein